jgi:hypothetical protein
MVGGMGFLATCTGGAVHRVDDLLPIDGVIHRLADANVVVGLFLGVHAR